MEAIERLWVVASLGRLELPGGVDVGWLSDDRLLALEWLARCWPAGRVPRGAVERCLAGLGMRACLGRGS
jgi:hypothetical protein